MDGEIYYSLCPLNSAIVTFAPPPPPPMKILNETLLVERYVPVEVHINYIGEVASPSML